MNIKLFLTVTKYLNYKTHTNYNLTLVANHKRIINWLQSSLETDFWWVSFRIKSFFRLFNFDFLSFVMIVFLVCSSNWFCDYLYCLWLTMILFQKSMPLVYHCLVHTGTGILNSRTILYLDYWLHKYTVRLWVFV